MFNDQSLEEFLEAHGVLESGRAYIRRIRQQPPSRLVSGGAKNVITRYPSRKMGRTIQAESYTCELPALWLWEHDSRTHEFWDQPEEIAVPIVRSDGKASRQPITADYFVLQDDFVGWVECKPLQWVLKRIEEGNVNFVEEGGRCRYLPGEKFAAEWGLQFTVRLAEENNRILVANLQMLNDYLIEGGHEVAPSSREQIIKRLGKAGWSTYADLVRGDDGIKADDVLALVANRTLYVDVENQLLSEPHRVHVYRDRDAAEIHGMLDAAKSGGESKKIAKVDLSPGKAISWDGKVWTIVNDGESAYFLVNDQQQHASIAKDLMGRLIGSGAVLADPAAPSAREELAAKRLAEADGGQRTEAARRYRALFPVQDASPAAIPSEGASPAKGTPPRTLRAWRSNYRRGLTLYGNGFIGLLPNTHKRGNRTRHLPEVTLEIIRQVWSKKYLTPEARTKTAAYGVIRLQCRAAGAVIPSQEAAVAELKRMHSDVEQVRAREGDKAAYQIQEWVWHLDETTPQHGQRPFHIAHIDHTELDIQLIDERFERKTRKCWATALIDAYSRMVLAVFLTFDPPSYRSCMSVIRACVQRHGRVPSIIVTDGGSDFRSKYFEELAAYLVIELRRRPKGSARHGSLIEGLFKRMTEGGITNFRGNNKPLQKPRSMSESHDPRKRAVWTLGKFIPRVQEFIDDVYANQPNSGLGVTPKVAFDLGERDFGLRDHCRIPFDEAFRMMCFPSTDSGDATVQSGGRMKINSLIYHASELALAGIAGSKLEVRYDPFNMGLAYAYLREKWVELRSTEYAVFQRYSEREVDAASQEIRDRSRGAYKNRQISAEILARYLLRIEQEEARLLAEKAIAAASSSSTAKADGKTERGRSAKQDEVSDEGAKDLFAGLPVEDYGDFE